MGTVSIKSRKTLVNAVEVCSCLLQPTEQSCHCPRNLLYSQDINAEQNRAITTGHFPEIT